MRWEFLYFKSCVSNNLERTILWIESKNVKCKHFNKNKEVSLDWRFQTSFVGVCEGGFGSVLCFSCRPEGLMVVTGALHGGYMVLYAGVLQWFLYLVIDIGM